MNDKQVNRANDAHVSGSWGEIMDFAEEMIHTKDHNATIGSIENEEGGKVYTMTFHGYPANQQVEEDLKDSADKLGYEEALNL